MKKLNLLLVFSALFSFMMLQSCTNNSKPQNEMQQPAAQDQATTNTPSTEGDEANENEGAKGSKALQPNTNGTINTKALNYKNMQEAFKGETTASAKYAAYSTKAEQEGQHSIAMLFKAASASEKIHANNHKAVLEEAGQSVPVIKPEFTVKTTRDNLNDAIAGESYEISTMYPSFITTANSIGDQFSLASLNYAYKTEQKHKPLYEKALAALDSNTANTLPTVFYICPTCGNTYELTAPKRCGISMTSSDKFIRISSVNS